MRVGRTVLAATGAVLVVSAVFGSGAPAFGVSNESVVADTPPGAVPGVLQAVSCRPGGTCLAVGHGSPGYPTLSLLRQNGIWSPIDIPVEGTYDQLLGVSCVSLTECSTVGYYSPVGGGIDTLIESWNGSAWTIVPSPNPSGNAALASVSCPVNKFCAAVGDYITNNLKGHITHTLIQQWSGKAWHTVKSPTLSTYAYLIGVSCLSTTWCMATGYSVPPGGDDGGATLTEVWNGVAWSTVPSPNVDSDDTLTGISCVSTSFCVAVGSDINGDNSRQTLIETWNGTSWSVTPTPVLEVAGQLTGVTCRAAGFCIAVGMSGATTSQTLVEAWNGTTWAVLPSFNRGPDDTLSGVSCVSASLCIAVGDNDTTKGYRTTALSIRP